jgi:hypothetical protein
VLAFVGIKMLVADRFRISDGVSLLVVGGLIIGAAAASFLFGPAEPRDDRENPPSDPPVS